VDHHGLAVDARSQQRLDLLGAADLLQHRIVVGPHDEAVLRILFQPEPAVPGHRFFDVYEQRMRHRETGVLQQCVQHLLGVQARRPRVPQAEGSQPVAVHVLGRALQLGKRRDGVPGLGGLLVVDFEEDRFVALDNQGAVVHAVKTFTDGCPLLLQYR
jgi:hypothetical protein